MIRVKNLTPFAFGYRISSRKPPQPELTAVVRAKLRLAPGEPMLPVKAQLTKLDLDDEIVPQETRDVIDEVGQVMGQGPLSADVFDDDDIAQVGPLRYASDLVPFKLNAEVLVAGSCYPPRGRAVAECDVGVEIGNWSKRLRVIGERRWVDRFVGGKATDPIPFRKMPLGWEHAFGGPDFPANPIGKGHHLAKPITEREGVEDWPESLKKALLHADLLPNVEDPHHLITRAGKEPKPAGFGPISPWWPHRKSKLGHEYGEDYEKKYAPYFPRDFDWTHLQAAPPDQQLRGYLRGDEAMRFENLHPEAADFRSQLPGLRVRAFLINDAGTKAELSMALDTLLADLDAEALYLTWRGVTPVREDDLHDVQALLIAAEDLADPPRPKTEYFDALDKFAADPVGLSETEIPKLQKLQDDIDSGQLERDIDAMDEDEHLMGNILERLSGPLIPPEQLQALKETTLEAGVQAIHNNPDSPKALKEAVKKTLAEGQDPPAPAVRMGADGKAAGGGDPLLKRMMSDLATQQKQLPQVDWSDVNEAIDDRLAELNDGTSGGEPLNMKAMLDRPLVEPAPGCDLSFQDLSDRDLRGVDLRGANLEGANLSRAKLVGANLDEANLSGASLARVDMSDASCRKANFGSALLSRTIAVRANFKEATLERSVLLKADLSDAHLDGANAFSWQASKVKLTGARLSGGNFEFCVFDDCDLAGASLIKTNAKRSLFRSCNLSGAKLSQAEVSRSGFIEATLCDLDARGLRGVGTNWLKSQLDNADFSHAVLPDNVFMLVMAPGANFSAVDMPGARFYKAALREVRFDHANLLGVDMRKASLSDCSFRGANLYEALLIEAHGVDVDFAKANLLNADFKRGRMVRKR